jgi:hypothetical protein
MSVINPYLDGLDVSNPDVTTPEEIAAFTAYCQRTKGGMIASHRFWLQFRPDVLKRQRARARLTSGESEFDFRLPHVLAYVHLYAILGFEEGILYEIKLSQAGGATKAELLDIFAIAYLHSGPRGMSAVESSSTDYLRTFADPEPSPKYPEHWSFDPNAYDSGMDYAVPEATTEDMERLESWYLATLGEVPPYAKFLMAHRPTLLKAYRNRYEHAIRDALPKQMMPYVMLNYNVVRGNPHGIRSNVLLGRAMGMTQKELLDSICWGMSYGGPGAIDVVNDAVGDLLTG